MMEFLQNLAYWHWLIAALVFLGIEILIPGTFFFLSLAVSAFVTGLLSAVWPQMDWSFQSILFAILSMLWLFVFRKALHAKQKVPNKEDLNQREANLIGQVYTLIEPIENGRGRVKIGDASWSVEGPDLPKGAQVRILKANGSILMVEKA